MRKVNADSLRNYKNLFFYLGVISYLCIAIKTYNNMKKLSLYDFMQEIGSFTTIDSVSLEKAKQSGINTSNSPKLKLLLNRWIKGMYDEDPDYLAQELEWLVS